MREINTIAFTPDGTHLIHGTPNGMVTITSIDTNATVLTIDTGVNGQMVIATSPDGTLLATGSTAGIVGLYDLASGTARHVWDCTGMGDLCRCLSFSSDGKKLVARVSMRASVYDVVSGEHEMTFSPVGGIPDGDVDRFAVFVPNSLDLVCGGLTTPTLMWHPEDQPDPPKSYVPKRDSHNRVLRYNDTIARGFSRCGKELICVTGENEVITYDTATAAEIRSFSISQDLYKSHVSPWNRYAIVSDDGRMVASSTKTQVAIVDLATEVIRMYDAGTNIRAMALSSDNARIAIMNTDGIQILTITDIAAVDGNRE